MFDYKPPVFGEDKNDSSIGSLSELFVEKRKDIVIRIKSISLDNFKSVKHGEIDLIEGLKPIPYSLEPSILGIYGQNGSGKTTLIGALTVLKQVLGGCLPEKNSNAFIAVDSEKATIKTTFEIQSKGSDIVEYITYEFSLGRTEENCKHSCKVCDEKVILKKMDFKGKLIQKSRVIFDSNSRNSVKNGKKMKIRVSIPQKPEIEPWEKIVDINEDREDALANGQSVFFGSYAISVFDDTDFGDDPWDENKNTFALPGSDYDYLVLLEHYALKNIMIAGAAAFNVFSDGGSPIYFIDGSQLKLDENGETKVFADDEPSLIKYLDHLNVLLKEIVPGLTLGYDVKEVKKSDGKVWLDPLRHEYINIGDHIDIQKIFPEGDNIYSLEKTIRVYTERDGIRIPICDESEGIKRIIYELDVLIGAFNNPGKIAIIDEFDAGIYEYLLGEILEIFERFGQGQLVFTSHNLRPLEVINRKFICFTTANRNNRYVKIKNLGKTNNLRDVYLRTIFADDREEKLYNSKDGYMIADAFRKAGMPE